MAFKILQFGVLPVYVLFIAISSLVLQYTTFNNLLIICGLLFLAANWVEQLYPKYLPYFRVAELLLLLGFHYSSQMNWCVALYLIVLSKILYTARGMVVSLLWGFTFVLSYSLVRLTYTSTSPYHLLGMVSDCIGALAVVLMIQYFILNEREKNELKEEKGLEEQFFQSQKLKVAGELAAGMAHEIRNPLTTVKGFLQLSEKQGYNIAPWYDVIIAEVNRMNKLTVEFLEFSKPHQSHYKVLSVHECLQKVLSITLSEAMILGHQIMYHEFQGELKVRMDVDKMVQVLVNLIKNAFEAMPEHGKVTLTLGCKDQHAVITLRDTGKGMDAKALRRVFEPFYTTKESGTGLGLPISLKIIEDHGGKMAVASELHKGTTFTIRLPLHMETN